jgi:hypothetical protein
MAPTITPPTPSRMRPAINIPARNEIRTPSHFVLNDEINSRFMAPVTRAVPMMQIIEPMNIAKRRPKLSEMVAMKNTPRTFPTQYEALSIPSRLPSGLWNSAHRSVSILNYNLLALHTLLPDFQLLHIVDQARIVPLNILAHQRNKQKKIQRSKTSILPPMAMFVVQRCRSRNDRAVSLCVEMGGHSRIV